MPNATLIGAKTVGRKRTECRPIFYIFIFKIPLRPFVGVGVVYNCGNFKT